MTQKTQETLISEEVKQYTDQQSLKLAFRMSVAFTILFIFLSVAYYYDSFQSFITMLLGILVSAFCFCYILIAKKYSLVFKIYSILGVVVTSYALIFFHKTVHLVEILWMLGGISLAYFSISKRFAFVLFLISIIAITIFAFYSLNLHIILLSPRSRYQQLTLVFELFTGLGLNFYIFALHKKLSSFSTNKIKEVNERLIQQNIQIKHQNEENITLVKEIHHRVKNNLQIIISLLRLQSNEAKSTEIKTQFQESINRILSMSLIQQKLYQNDNFMQINFVNYCDELVAAIIDTDTKQRDVQYRIQSEIKTLNTDQLTHLGLIINELVSNSLKHAFHNQANPSIQIKLKQEYANLLLIYSDNGSWVEPQENSTSFGLDLIDTLIYQFEGTYEIKKEANQTVFLMTFEQVN